jgi:hypothetical protein
MCKVVQDFTIFLFGKLSYFGCGALSLASPSHNVEYWHSYFCSGQRSFLFETSTMLRLINCEEKGGFFVKTHISTILELPKTQW